MSRVDPPVGLAIAGATATGKTELALAVARRLDGEIISVDSRQAYRGLEVGTAAPSAEARRAVPHHGVAFLSPTETYSAGQFARLARGWVEEIRHRGRVPILAGGTGFFLRALMEPVFDEPALHPERRSRLRRWFEAQPRGALRRWAQRLDPVWASRQESPDRQRASRAIELALLSGRPLSWWHEHARPTAEPVPLLVFGLGLPPDVHRKMIRRRTEMQLDSGWQEEVTKLRRAGVPEDAPAMDAVGYREVAALLDDVLELEDAAREIARRTWRYARRQGTWLRHQLPGLRWLDATSPIEQLADRVEREWIAAVRGAPGELGGAAGAGHPRGAQVVGEVSADAGAAGPAPDE